MKLEKIVDRINLLGTELDAMVKNDKLDMFFRTTAGRLHFDLIDDYNYCINANVSLGVLREVMKEYEAATMDLYKEM